MKLISRAADDDDKRWPSYVFGGRMRTSTIGLIVAFFFTSWLYETYRPPPPEPAPATQVVPPGFVPDPEYTWVPRTNVEVPRTRYPTTTTTTTTTTTEPPTTTTTSPTDPTNTTSPGETPTSSEVTPPTTTVVDPDGPNGLIPPITLPVLPGAAPSPTPQTIATPPPPARTAN